MVKLGNSIGVYDMPLMGGLVCVFISFVFYLISYSSPFWLVTFRNAYSPFVRMGMWSVCFNNFIHPDDYKNNRWSGCYWLYNPIIYINGLWIFINPYWLIAVQVLITIGFILQCITVICVILYFLLIGNPIIESTIALFCQIGSVVLMSVCVITFAIYSDDRSWQMRPDLNFFGFSFGFACLVIFYGLLATFFLTLVYCGDKFFKNKHLFDELRQLDDRSRMTTGAKSSKYHAPASYFAGTGSTKQPLYIPSQMGSELQSSIY